MSSKKSKNNEKIQIITKNKKVTIPILTIIVVTIIIIFFIPKKENNIEIKIQSSLDKIIAKSDLETVNITYNVIAKKCKKDNCDTNSNKINDFEYVASCKGTITAGIDFNDVKIAVDKKNKNITIEIPNATIKDKPSIGKIDFLNGQKIPADKYPDIMKFCQETIIKKSNEDNNLIPLAKEQAIIVLEGFYNQWIKAYDNSYKVEVK